VTGRVHRMTELFGHLAPGATLESARAELRTAYAAMLKEHPEAYAKQADFRIDATMLRDQITSRARTVLLVLLAASGLVFIIACSNVANLVLSRTVRREGEMAIRAALGANAGALRRTLLAESLLLCGAGAALGVLIAWPIVAVLGRYAARFSVRALDLKVDSSLLWVGTALAVFAAVLLAYIPRLPSADTRKGLSLSNGSIRITGSTSRRLRLFTVTQIAASFILLAGAGALLKTLIALQAAQTGLDTQHVLAINVPVITYGKTPDQIVGFYKESMRRIKELPGVDTVAVGTVVPWRDAGSFGPGFEFSADGHVRAPGEEDPRAQLRAISPNFFAALGVPIIAGRDFNDADRRDSESVVIVSQSLAQRMFPNQDAVNRHVMWTDPVMKFIDISEAPRRIVGVVADVDDEHVNPGPAWTVYHPFEQQTWGGRLFVHTRANPYTLVTPITRIIRDLSVDQPVERAATLEDVRAEVLAPDRLNTLVFGGFAAVALLIALVGVAGVLAFSVSARTREFGVRIALGAQAGKILTSVLMEGVVIAVIGVAAGVFVGFGLLRLLGNSVLELKTPGMLPLIGSAVVILAAAVVASAVPAARAARVDTVRALRAD
jgi:putative ABC transport system permease protein